MLYKKADLYINASHIEGFSSATIDAINYNLPIICSDCKGAMREIVRNGKGADLFNVGDYKNLSKKIIFFYKNPNKLKKKLKLSRKNIKNFSIKKSVQKYEFVFKKI